MNTKGFSTVFTVIITLLFLGVFALLGYQLLDRFFLVSEEATYLAFQTDFQDVVSMVYHLQPGSRIVVGTERVLRLPSDITKVCVTSTENLRTEGLTDLERRVLGSTQDNVVVFPLDNRFPDFTITHLYPDENPLCLPVQSGRLRFELHNEIHEEIQVIIRE